MRTDYRLFSLALGLLVLGACADKAADEVPAPTPSTTPTEDRGDTTTTSAKRLCLDEDDVIQNVTKSSIAGFFGVFPKNVEGDVTHCFEFTGTGSNVSGQIRIEFEDDKGVTHFPKSGLEVSQAGWSTLKQVSGKWKLDVIWMDGMGLIQLVATETAVESGRLKGEIRFYNFPSYEDALDEALDEVRQKCLSGEWKVARCLGYASPYPSIKWWQNNETAWNPAQKARELLTSEGTVFGKVEFDL